MPLVMPCPNLDELEQLAAGLLPELQHAAFERHVLNCALCQSRLAALDENDDLFSDLMESVPPLPAGAEDSANSLNLTAHDSGHHPLSGDATEMFPHVLGDFRIVREIGRGGMGYVFEAIQIRLHRRVALKVLPFVNLLDPNRLRRFQNESRAAASLDHLNIVPVYDVGSDRGIHYYAMLYIDGQNLAQVIAQLNTRLGDTLQENSEGAAEPSPGRRVLPSQTTVAFSAHRELLYGHYSGLHVPEGSTEELVYPHGGPSGAASRPLAKPFAECVPLGHNYIRLIARLGIDAARALAYAHENGVIHRDIKPSNMMCDDQGRLWITDFGLARMESDAASTAGRPIQGTPRYMSPEQAFGHRGVVDHRSDIYSLGVTLYELLTLTPIFPEAQQHALLTSIRNEEPTAPRQLNRNIPRDLETIVLSAMSKEPRDRYNNAKELADDLGRFLANEPIRARRPAVTERIAKWVRRNPSSLSFAALLMIAILAAAGGLAVYSRGMSLANRRLDHVNSELAGVQEDLKQALNDVTASELAARQQVYALGIRQAWNTINAKDPRQALNILARHIPDPEEDDLRGFEWNLLWNRCLGRGFTIPVSDKPLHDVKFSNDRRYMAVAGADSIVRIWDATNWSRVGADILTGQAEINAVAFSPDGRTIATSGDDRSIALFDFPSLKIRHRIPDTHREKTYGVVYTPDGKQIVTCGDDEAIRFWNPQTGAPEGEIVEHSNTINNVVIANSGRFLVSASSDGTSKIWKLPERTLLRTMQPRGGRVVAAAISPDDKRIATAAVDFSLDVWDVETGKQQRLATLRDTVQAIVFIENGEKLAVSDRGGTVHLYALKTAAPAGPENSAGTETDAPIGEETNAWQGHNDRGQALAISPDGSKILSAGWDGKLRVIEFRDGNDDARISLNLHSRSSAFKFTSADELIYCESPAEVKAGAKQSVWVQQPASSTEKRFENTTPWPISSAALSSDGTKIFFGHATGKVSHRAATDSSTPTIWDLSTTSDVSEILVTPDGTTVVAGVPRDEDSVRVFNFPKGTRRSRFPKRDGQYLTLSPDGRTLGFAFESQAFLWDLQSDDSNQRIIDGIESVRRMAFSSDGTLVAIGGEERTIRIYDVETLTLRTNEITGHDSEILGLSFSPDGKTLISGDRLGKVQLWHVASGRHLLNLAECGPQNLDRVAFSPRGRFFAYSQLGADRPSIVVHDLERLQSETFVDDAPVTRVVRPSEPK
ncbi:MAG: protein kinase [Planctomycetaceae bacterium]